MTHTDENVVKFRLPVTFFMQGFQIKLLFSDVVLLKPTKPYLLRKCLEETFVLDCYQQQNRNCKNKFRKTEENDRILVVNFGTGMSASEAKSFCNSHNMEYPSDQLDHFPSLFKQIENFLGKSKVRSRLNLQTR